MKIPVVTGKIERRILVNYRIDPTVLAQVLPAPFEPKLHGGYGVAGICLIRLTHIRPRFLPGNIGISSENAAHRIAVRWQQYGSWCEGVYIPRRDTSSVLNTLAGGRLFPGVHHAAKFQVCEDERVYRVELQSRDDETQLVVEGTRTTHLPATSVFSSLEVASQFFEAGSLGYSATRRDGHYDGLELRSFNWEVEPLNVTEVKSSFFNDSSLFPSGTVEFDCALLMRNIKHEWHAREALCLN